MDINELQKKIKRIEIKSKSLTKQLFSGAYQSSLKGRGMAFSEVREYEIGDEVRTIDWNVTARFNEPFVKVFHEEKEMTVMLLIDVSGSIDFGTLKKTKKELGIEIAAVLAFSAITNNDKVGAIFVSDRVEKFIPPLKGRKHALLILREMMNFESESKGTNLNVGLKFYRDIIKYRSTGFVISDFVSNNSFIEGFNVTGRKHELSAIRIMDAAERDLPDLGMIEVENAEIGKSSWINTSAIQVKKKYRDNFINFENEIKLIFRKAGIDYTTIQTNEDYIPKLIQLFQLKK